MTDEKRGSKGVVWDFEGTHLLPRELASVLYDGGFKGLDALTTAVAVFLAESEGWTQAWHKNIRDGETISMDWGLAQINDASYPAIIPMRDEPDTRPTWVAQAKFAHDIYRQHGFNKWVAFTSGAWKRTDRNYITRAINGVCNSQKVRYGLTLVH